MKITLNNLMKENTKRENLTAKVLKETAIKILMSNTYAGLGGDVCAEYITKELKKNPNRKGKQFYIDKN